ncbi:DNA-binding protein WhiA [Candidatus Xianfuyuplasma coldseepsis]|uniref:Probable cell division protein WhiA n=1 Tax=Candidatus Xianfuyuplasma coldseepsis TaxID=2782163 RepID=A0A7L7KRP6_9MOLU|nr:DNA-binding protein WhiA [Xianfuyuplasma coldseepsis]QMS84876.1 DNA-binding protein WhiA [Xianfuyuplasma coldseepsis]
MSFAADVKSELLSVKADNCCVLAELSALLRINGDIHISSNGLSVEFHTTNLKIARRVISSVKELYKIDVEVVSKKQMKLYKHDMYIVRMKQEANKIINELSLMNNQEAIIDEPLMVKECCKRSFLRGAFLASGSINSPKSSSYHLEIHSYSEEDVTAVTDLLNYYHLNAKSLKRKRGFISYIKESEKIADFLRVVGAMNALFVYEDERIKRDFVNSITRVMNMDIANQNKTLEAADKQLRSISVLENMTDITKLPNSMKEAITLRKTYPESSLNELADYSYDLFNKSISKSALNHRFRNINELADQIMENLHE